MKKTGTLDGFERSVRSLLGIALALIAWDYGWTVVGTGAVLLAIVALATATMGSCPANRALARFDRP